MPDAPELKVPPSVSAPQPVWLIDCGNFMSPGRYFPELRGQTHLKAMAALGCVAVVPGHEELALAPAQATAALSVGAGLLVSCNLTSKDMAIEVRPYAEPAPGWYVIGVSAWEPAPNPPPADRWWELGEPVAAVKALLEELPAGARAVLIALNQPDNVIEQLAALPVVAVVGYAGEREVWPMGSAPVYPAPAPKGDYIDLVALVDSAEITAQEYWRIRVDERWGDDSRINELLVAELDQRLALIRKEREEKWGKGGYENIEWGTSDKYLPQKSETELAAQRGEAVYIGVRDCAMCHAEEYKKWFSSRHAHAFISLKEGESQDNIDCLNCHSTGLLESGGFDPFAQRDAVSAVGCESCHGPGSIHALNMQGQGPYNGPGIQAGSAAGCVKCHDATNSPEFNFEQYWPQIEH